MLAANHRFTQRQSEQPSRRAGVGLTGDEAPAERSFPYPNRAPLALKFVL